MKDFNYWVLENFRSGDYLQCAFCFALEKSHGSNRINMNEFLSIKASNMKHVVT
jgi:hypothetical protein